jgi:hypothetical protein
MESEKNVRKIRKSRRTICEIKIDEEKIGKE